MFESNYFPKCFNGAEAFEMRTPNNVPVIFLSSFPAGSCPLTTLYESCCPLAWSACPAGNVCLNFVSQNTSSQLACFSIAWQMSICNVYTMSSQTELFPPSKRYQEPQKRTLEQFNWLHVKYRNLVWKAALCSLPRGATDFSQHWKITREQWPASFLCLPTTPSPDPSPSSLHSLPAPCSSWSLPMPAASHFPWPRGMLRFRDRSQLQPNPVNCFLSAAFIVQEYPLVGVCKSNSIGLKYSQTLSVNIKHSAGGLS